MIEVTVEELQRAVEELHDCTATSIGTEAVSETFGDRSVWDGIVHLFELADHPKATRVYAWSSAIEGSTKRRFFAVLHIPPVTSPLEAVRAAIVQEHKESEI